jgi:hypothetical protein
VRQRFAPDMSHWRRTADIEDHYRFRLGRYLIGARSYATWLMLNPSRADERGDDPTVCRVVDFSYHWGHDAVDVVNLIPFRSARPSESRKWLRSVSDGAFDAASRRNREEIAKSLERSERLVCAWGADNATCSRRKVRGRKFLEEFFEDYPTLAKKYSGRDRVVCLKVNDDGTPRHPLARGRHWVPSGSGWQPFPLRDLN